MRRSNLWSERFIAVAVMVTALGCWDHFRSRMRSGRRLTSTPARYDLHSRMLLGGGLTSTPARYDLHSRMLLGEGLTSTPARYDLHSHMLLAGGLAFPLAHSVILGQFLPALGREIDCQLGHPRRCEIVHIDFLTIQKRIDDLRVKVMQLQRAPAFHPNATSLAPHLNTCTLRSANNRL